MKYFLYYFLTRIFSISDDTKIKWFFKDDKLLSCDVDNIFFMTLYGTRMEDIKCFAIINQDLKDVTNTFFKFCKNNNIIIENITKNDIEIFQFFLEISF